MASEPMSFDDFEETQVEDDYDDGVEEIKFDVDEPVIGVIVDIDRDVGPNENDVIHLARGGDLGDRVKFWSNGQIRRTIDKKGLGNGSWLAVKKTAETRTYEIEHDDGSTEEREYHVFDVRGE
uniref:Uncharacterized protein n=4 Tax=Haloferax volcanii TaxID=2246 RepID=D3JVC7_HALL2|nr:hypothetical protein [Haloferax sp. BAB-2207]AAB09608.1 ORF2 [Haloferax lucentense DSM 14919]ADB79726.1 unknown [Haloferax lucentense DSM 14919]UGC01924.1 hypothetical protein [Reporter vector pRV2]prf//2106196B ORF 2 [Haloferax sp.]